MSSRPESRRRERVGALYRVGSLVCFWGVRAFLGAQDREESMERIEFGIVSRIKNGTVLYFGSVQGRASMNRFAFENELERGERATITVEVY